MSDLAFPTDSAPKAVTTAAATYAERLADLRRAVAAESSADAGIAEARKLDVLALADARDAGGKEPDREHERRAEAQLERASRSARAEKLRFDRARDALLAAVADHGAEWSRRLEAAWRKLDDEATKALDRYEEVEAQRARFAPWRCGSAKSRPPRAEALKRRCVGRRTATPRSTPRSKTRGTPGPCCR